MTPQEDDDLESLVAQCLQAIDGSDATGTVERMVAELTADRPKLAEPLARRLERLRGLGFLSESKGRDETPEVSGYEFRSCLGAGGMGEVWLALQQVPVRRPVALKVVRNDRMDARALRRFESEQQALARMSHPGIAQVYDAGTTKRGHPYFAMEFVDGQTIDEACRAHDLDLRGRVELMASVCDAIQHAHERGVLHRDLKPHNILITEVDGRLQPKVIDFGLAKSVEPDGLGAPSETLVGQVLGTPQYMAPEQADPDSQDIDVRVDVYALGAVLFELLTGTLPIELPNDSVLEALRRIRSAERAVLSSRLKFLAGETESDAERPHLRSWSHQSRGDLDRISRRALQVDPKLRYASVAALAEDLRSFLAYRPINAAPQTTIYRLRKFAKRRRGTFLTAVAIFLTAAVGLGFALHYQVQARRSLTWFDQLAERDEVEQLIARADLVGPMTPSGLPSLREWLDESGGLVARRGDVRSILEETRSRAANPDAEQLADRGYDQGRFEVLDESLQLLIRDLDQLAERRTEVARWERFADTLHEGSAPEHRELWNAAIRSIASPDECPLYRGLQIEAQTGLVPLHRDPETTLWEFEVQWPGASRPSVDDQGQTILRAGDAPVVVLLPGGRFHMGSEIREGEPFFDEFASHDEDPRHLVQLDPFFIGKYELTQTQWKLLTTESPSFVTKDFNNNRAGRRLEDPIDDSHPVERVNWFEATTWLQRIGLELPTEARWEYAARGNTETPWWTGEDRSSLGRVTAGNLADERARPTQLFTNYESGLDDGYLYHGPVDLGAPNPFGLYGTIGNVWEWVQDENHFYEIVRPRTGDGLRESDASEAPEGQRNIRGGGFDVTAQKARHAQRISKSATFRSPGVGVRLCRSLSSTNQ